LGLPAITEETDKKAKCYTQCPVIGHSVQRCDWFVMNIVSD